MREIGDILAQYEAHLEEAIAWFEEALPELGRIRFLPDGIELLYSYFKALFKLPNGPAKILEWLPRFIDMVLASQARGMYYYVQVWLHYLLPHFGNQLRFQSLYKETLNRFKSMDRTDMGLLSVAYLDETILFLELPSVGKNEERLEDWFGQVENFLRRVREFESFPVHRIAGTLGAMAPFWKNLPKYEACFELAIELENRQVGGFAKADILKDRAIAHHKQGQVNDAIIMGTRAKVLWLNERSIRGYLLVTYALATWYREIGLLQAAEYELLEGIHIATWQPSYMHPDILAAMILQLTNVALIQGRVLRAYRWLLDYYPICKQYRIEPKEKVLDQLLRNNLALLLARLYSVNRPVHDRLVKLAEKFGSDFLLAHKEILLSSETEFETYLQDIPPEQQTDMRSLRYRVRSGELKPIENWIDYDELAKEQYLEWHTPILYLAVCRREA